MLWMNRQKQYPLSELCTVGAIGLIYCNAQCFAGGYDNKRHSTRGIVSSTFLIGIGLIKQMVDYCFTYTICFVKGVILWRKLWLIFVWMKI